MNRRATGATRPVAPVDDFFAFWMAWRITSGRFILQVFIHPLGDVLKAGDALIGAAYP